LLIFRPNAPIFYALITELRRNHLDIIGNKYQIMADRGNAANRPARPGPPMHARGPPPASNRPRFEPVDREKVFDSLYDFIRVCIFMLLI
jgi:hypothetical protein